MRHSLRPAREVLDRSTTKQSRVASDFASARGASPPLCAPWARAVWDSERRAAAAALVEEVRALPASAPALWAWVLASAFRAPQEFGSPAASARSHQI